MNENMHWLVVGSLVGWLAKEVDATFISQMVYKCMSWCSCWVGICTWIRIGIRNNQVDAYFHGLSERPSNATHGGVDGDGDVVVVHVPLNEP